MQLDGIQIALRSRTSWEAADLGIALTRQHARLIARSWCLFGLPLFALLNAVFYALDMLWLATALLWWLKPWFDQLVLHILSRAVFSAPPSPLATLKQQFRMRAVLPWLLWRRIDFARGLTMPVSLLEGLRGRARSERFGVLGRSSTSAVAIGLCVVLANIEAAIYLSLFVLVLMFVPFEFLPESAQIMFEVLFEDPPRWAQVATNAAYFLSMSVIEPFFVGAGFALYLNRRTQLEAWDIELAFRRIAQRLGALGLVFALALGGLISAGEVAAASMTNTTGAAAVEADVTTAEIDEAEGEEEAWTAEVIEARELEAIFTEHPRDAGFAAQIGKTLQAKAFGEKKTLQRWERINPLTDQPTRSESPFIALLSEIFGFFAKFGLWILLAVLIVFVILRFSQWRLPLLERLRLRSAAAEPQVEDDAVPEALPDDVVAAARALFARGAVRAAMSLLYRGACSGLPLRPGVTLTPGATESEILRHVRAIEDRTVRDALSDVVRNWQRTAYAAELPDAAGFEAVAARYAAARLVPR